MVEVEEIPRLCAEGALDLLGDPDGPIADGMYLRVGAAARRHGARAELVAGRGQIAQRAADARRHRARGMRETQTGLHPAQPPLFPAIAGRRVRVVSGRVHGHQLPSISTMCRATPGPTGAAGSADGSRRVVPPWRSVVARTVLTGTSTPLCSAVSSPRRQTAHRRQDP